jgi:hypothetical protein
MIGVLAAERYYTKQVSDGTQTGVKPVPARHRMGKTRHQAVDNLFIQLFLEQAACLYLLRAVFDEIAAAEKASSLLLCHDAPYWGVAPLRMQGSRNGDRLNSQVRRGGAVRGFQPLMHKPSNWLINRIVFME